MKQTGALGGKSADGVQMEPSPRLLQGIQPFQRAQPHQSALPLEGMLPLGETWRARAGVGVALATAALLMSACADASSTTGRRGIRTVDAHERCSECREQ